MVGVTYILIKAMEVLSEDRAKKAAVAASEGKVMAEDPLDKQVRDGIEGTLI